MGEGLVEERRLGDEVPVFWFEDIGLLNEPLLDSPFGRFTVRQVVILGVFGLVAWIVQGFFNDPVFKVGIIVFTMFFGGYLAFSKTKTIPVEKSITLALGIGKPKLRRFRKRKVKLEEESQKPEAGRIGEVVKVNTKTMKVIVLSKPSRIIGISTNLDEPIRITTLIRDKVTGEPLANKPFKVYLDGKEHSTGITDQDGGLITYLTAKSYGKVRVDVFVEGYVEPVDSFTLNIKPRKT